MLQGKKHIHDVLPARTPTKLVKEQGHFDQIDNELSKVLVKARVAEEGGKGGC